MNKQLQALTEKHGRRHKHIHVVGRGIPPLAYILFPVALLIYVDAMFACMLDSISSNWCSFFTNLPWAIGLLAVCIYLYFLFLLHEIGHDRNQAHTKRSRKKSKRITWHHTHTGFATLPQEQHRFIRHAHRAGTFILAGCVTYFSVRFINPHTFVTIGLALTTIALGELFNCWGKPRVTQAWRDLLYPGDATDYFQRRTMPAFEPNARGYSPVNALWLMELSRLVYRHDIEEEDPAPQPTRSTLLAQGGFRQIKFFESELTDTQAMLVESTTQPRYAALVFRGTEQNPKDLSTDLDIGMPESDPDSIDVHDGFKDALDKHPENQKSIWEEIETELRKLDCPVYYTGHSLGAALATLAAARIKPQAVYTFGSPRVGNQAFVNSLAGIPIYRVVDGDDIVTTVPPGFVNTGETHELSSPKSGLIHWLKNICMPPKALADHTPVKYVDRILPVATNTEKTQGGK